MELVRIPSNNINSNNVIFNKICINFMVTITIIVVSLFIFIKNKLKEHSEKTYLEIKNCQKEIKEIKEKINRNNHDNETIEHVLILVESKLKNIETKLIINNEKCVKTKYKINEIKNQLEKDFTNKYDKIHNNMLILVEDTDRQINNIKLLNNSIQEEISNVSYGLTIIPNSIAGFYNINVEEILFWGNNSGGCYYLTIYEGNNYSDTNRNMLLNNLYTYHNNPYVFNFLEQFKKIKSVYFEINCSVKGKACNEKYSKDTDEMSSAIFHQIAKINPSINVYYKCKNIWDNEDRPSVLDAFTETTNYKSFHLEIENNFVKDTSGYIKHVSSTISNKIKEHCVNNNIEFISNIGI